MRIIFGSIDHAIFLANVLRSALAAHGNAVTLAVCERHVAAMTGYGTWTDLVEACAAGLMPSPADEDVAAGAAFGRRNQYVSVLAPLYGPAAARAIVDEIRPSGRRPSGDGSGFSVSRPTNAAFDAIRKAEPSLGYQRRESDKVELATTSGEVASALLGLLDMDPTVLKVLPTPATLHLSSEGRSATLTIDFAVLTILGHRWNVHVASPEMVAGPGRWIPGEAVRAMDALGERLVIVDPCVAMARAFSGAKLAADRSFSVRVTREYGEILRQVVEDGPEGGMTYDEVSKAFANRAWPKPPAGDGRRKPSRSYDRDDTNTLLSHWSLSRAMREGYVDYDPATVHRNGKCRIARRHAFLESRTAIGVLSPWAVASTNIGLLADIDADLRATVRSHPVGHRFEETELADPDLGTARSAAP
jgi:hypothetical protein